MQTSQNIVLTADYVSHTTKENRFIVLNLALPHIQTDKKTIRITIGQEGILPQTNLGHILPFFDVKCAENGLKGNRIEKYVIPENANTKMFKVR